MSELTTAGVFVLGIMLGIGIACLIFCVVMNWKGISKK